MEWTLTGDQQLPPNDTNALGYVGLKFQDDRTRLVYIVNAEHIGKITAVNLYQTDKEQNGTLVLDLLHSPRELMKGVDKVVEKNSGRENQRNNIYWRRNKR